MSPGGPASSTTVVVMTRNRAARLERTLAVLVDLTPEVPVIVVDNGSTDGTPAMVEAHYPNVQVVPLGSNRLAMARNVGVGVAETEFVAFSDDDSWWMPRALRTAEDILRESPNVGLVAARILVGAQRRLDPTCLLMEESPLAPDVDGRSRVLGFLACAAVVRRSAFLEAGGFDDLIGFAGEEAALAIDLATCGWDLVYAPQVVAVHEPDGDGRRPAERRRMEMRNTLVSALVRRRRPFGKWGDAAVRSLSDADMRAALLAATIRVPRALRRRRPVPEAVEAQLRTLERLPSPQTIWESRQVGIATGRNHDRSES